MTRILHFLEKESTMSFLYSLWRLDLHPTMDGSFVIKFDRIRKILVKAMNRV